jgi:hypothetical protein
MNDQNLEEIHQQFAIGPTLELGVGNTLGYMWNGGHVVSASYNRLKPAILLVTSYHKWIFEMLPNTRHRRLAELLDL